MATTDNKSPIEYVTKAELAVLQSEMEVFKKFMDQKKKSVKVKVNKKEDIELPDPSHFVESLGLVSQLKNVKASNATWFKAAATAHPQYFDYFAKMIRAEYADYDKELMLVSGFKEAKDAEKTKKEVDSMWGYLNGSLGATGEANKQNKADFAKCKELFEIAAKTKDDVDSTAEPDEETSSSSTKTKATKKTASPKKAAAAAKTMIKAAKSAADTKVKEEINKIEDVNVEDENEEFEEAPKTKKATPKKTKATGAPKTPTSKK
jgi:hypothetical protein